MEATLRSDEALPIFESAAERFKEVTCTGLLNWWALGGRWVQGLWFGPRPAAFSCPGRLLGAAHTGA
jgi:hypothetical protein